MALAPLGKINPLTTKDRAFLAAYFQSGLNATKAYLLMCEKLGTSCTQGSAEVLGCKALKRVRASGDFRAILEIRGLDDLRLADEIDRLLKIKKTYINGKGDVIDYDDGQTQVKAAEMLKDVLGHSTKTEINLTTDLPAIIIETPKDDD